MGKDEIVKCGFCGNIGRPKRYYRGSRQLEFYLWFIFLIPGPFYTLWRLRTGYDGCSVCGSTNLKPYEGDPIHPSSASSSHHF